jgi:hypothetical protein
MNQAPSKAATAVNAQHEPQLPWFLIGFTAPRLIQSKNNFVNFHKAQFNMSLPNSIPVKFDL